jgi:phospholipid/cholesterol/gamma-HCH transport system substrate-binding protein
MTSYRKNILVGVTMIVALAFLGLMILLFGEAPVRLVRASQTKLLFLADTAEGISNGSPIYYLGVNVGQVTAVELPADRAQPGVTIRGVIRSRATLPGNVEAVIRSTLIGGTASLSLEPVGGIPKGELATGQTIRARVGGSNVLPREFAELASQLTELSQRLQTSVDDWNKSRVIDKVASTLDSVHQTVDKFGATSDELRKLLADDQMRGDLKTTLANFREVSTNAKTIAANLDKLSTDLQKTNADISRVVTTTGTRVDDLSKQLGARLEQVAVILDRFGSVATKVDQGQGTAGKLVNDPKLYDALLDSSQELSLTIKDLRRLVEQWEQEGVSVKLGGKK